MRMALYRIALNRTKNRDSAEDLVQTAILQGLESLHRFDGRNLGGWLATILINQFSNQSRRERRERRHARATLEVLGHDKSSRNGNQQDRLELQDLVNYAETDVKRQMAIYAAITGDDYVKIAGVWRVPHGTAKSRISRARDEFNNPEFSSRVRPGPQRNHTSGYSSLLSALARGRRADSPPLPAPGPS